MGYSEMWGGDFAPDTGLGKEGGAAALAELSGFQNCCVAEYVWVDSNGQTRSKCKTIDKTPMSADDCTIWTFNGAATNQANPESSDVYLIPRKVFADPIRGTPNVLVVCECVTSAMEPAMGNHRAYAAEVMEKYSQCDPWFGLEQEYVITDDQGVPLESAGKRNEGYCGRGAFNLPKFMREIMGDHYAMCLSAGIKISGMNCEDGQAQAEFQIGPCKGLNAGDHMIAARHTLHKCANKYRCAISFEPWNRETDTSSGLHCNFSSRKTRQDGGLMWIEKCVKALGEDDSVDSAAAAYGKNNELRLTGKNGAPDGSKFRYGVADRGGSCRIPRSVGIVAKGHFEDRRPGANADPYKVTGYLMSTCGKTLLKA